uniref:RING-type domain-containing protein n=1 Tax=Saimiri boliviensis boliviensis TaxID=39432 RepID=A0A2K6TT25_SAIBB
MFVDENNQWSDSNKENYDPNCKKEDEDPGDIEDYYMAVASNVGQQGTDASDLEENQLTCLNCKECEASVLKVFHSVTKLMLVNFHWHVSEILDRYKSNSAQLLVEAQVQPNPSKHVPTSHPPHHCAVCMQFQHCLVLVKDSVGEGVSCVAQDCPFHTPEDFVFPLLPNEELKEKYRCYLFRDHVESHYQLQLCPGAERPMAIWVQEPREVFCFKCHQMYQTPTDCATIRKWLTKCADDSGSANYISAHTKDGPKCNVCIEKSGGCNHFQCSKCKYIFGYTRETLKKYLFCFESLQLEAETYQVMNNLETWINQQYLQNAAKLLTKCRYTLQYTDPHAYYQSGPRKKVFEYQQAEMKNLSWKVECADSYDREDMESQMHTAEQRRRSLLKDFHDT